MIKVGITGGIGSGKTTVCKIFELLGVPVYYSDEWAKRMLDDESVVKNIVNYFGDSVLTADKIDRKKLASLVFNNSEKLTYLNSIIHPAVKNHFEDWYKKQNTTYILKEAAILFESEAYKQVDKAITVSAPELIRVKRVVKRDLSLEADVLARIKNQLTDEERIKRSDFVIINDDANLVIPQVLAIHDKIMGEIINQ